MISHGRLTCRGTVESVVYGNVFIGFFFLSFCIEKILNVIKDSLDRQFSSVICCVLVGLPCATFTIKSKLNTMWFRNDSTLEKQWDGFHRLC